MSTSAKSDCLDDLAAQLVDKRSAKRRAAAKKLRKRRDPAAGPALAAALDAEVADQRTWETQYQMIMALAESGVHDALPLLRRIAAMDLEPMVLIAVGDALVRLGDVDNALHDAFQSSSQAIVEGALRGTAMLRATPTGDVINAILSYAAKPENAQVRFWVAAAAPGWTSTPSLEDFLRSCLRDSLEDTRRAAAAALEKRYLKWNPL